MSLLCWQCQTPAADDVEPAPAQAGRAGAVDLDAIARERPIAFASTRSNDVQNELFLVRPDGSDVTRVSTLRSVVDPVWSPDGRAIAFRRQASVGVERYLSRVELMLADASERVVLAEEEPVTLEFERSRPRGSVSWSPDGLSLAYASPRGAAHLRIWGMARSGGQQRLLFPDWDYPHYSPSWSPRDASQLAYVAQIGDARDVWLVDPENPAEPRNLTEGRVLALGGLRWSPNGDRLAFSALDPEPATPGGVDREIYVLTLSTGRLTQVTEDDAADTEPTWSPDGTSILFASDRLRRASGAPQSALLSDLWLVSLEAPEQAVNITPGGGGDDTQADWYWPRSELEP